MLMGILPCLVFFIFACSVKTQDIHHNIDSAITKQRGHENAAEYEKIKMSFGASD